MTDLKAIEVTAKVTYTYTPREYLDYCEEYNVVPTQEGFEDFIADNYLDEEFTDKGLTITEVLRVDYEKTY